MNRDFFQIVIDNKVSVIPGIIKEWGLSIYIKFGKHNILFDTGASYRALYNNLNKMNIIPNKIDLLFLTHNHLDHLGGVHYLFDSGFDGTIVLIPSIYERLKKAIDWHYRYIIIEKSDVSQIMEGVYSTGILGSRIKEHSLILRKGSKTYIFTGCSHPGITNIVKHTKKYIKGEIAYLVGGFHLLYKTYSEIHKIAKKLKEEGVRNIMPIHCSGHNAQKPFYEVFQKQYIAGKIGEKYYL